MDLKTKYYIGFVLNIGDFFPIFDDSVDGYSIFPLGRKWVFGLVKKKVESILIQFSNKIHVYQVTRVQMKNNAHY